MCLGCYSTVEVKLPNEDPFLTVNSINFQSDSTWLIEISKSQPILNSDAHLLVSNAQVSIKDEDGIELTLEPVIIKNRTFYTSNVKPVVNKLYEITVMASGLPTAKASSKIPIPVPISKFEIDSTYLKEVIEIRKQNPNYTIDFNKSVPCKVTFIDPPGEKNFYDLQLHFEYTTSAKDESGQLIFTKRVEDIPVVDENGASVNMLTTDTEFNRASYSMDFNIPLAVFLSEVDRIYISLLTLNSAYFNYLHTYDLQNTAIVDPFAQPVIVFSNIKNGAGIFAGFSTSILTLSNQEDER
jgi:hypothetical protein